MLTKAATVSGLALLAAGPVWAQDGGSAGFSLGVTLSEQLLYEDDDGKLRTDLGLTFERRTRSQSFTLSASAGLEKALSSGGDDGLDDPRLSLGYALESRDVLTRIDLSHRRSDLDTLAREDEVGQDPLAIGAGRRENTVMNFVLEVGRAAPFGATLDFSHGEVDYFGTSSTTLVDQTTTQSALRLRFDLNRATTATLDLSKSDLNREGGVDVESERVTAAIDVALSDAMSLSASLGAASVTQINGALRSVQDGTSYSLGVTAERPNGIWRASVTSDIGENGRRSTVRLDRSIDLPRGSFSAGAGISRNDDTNSSNPTYALNYVQDLPRGQMRASFDQSFSTDAVGTETLDSRLRLAYQQELTPLSSLSAGLSVRDFDRLASGAIDSKQVDLTVDYAYTISDDWAVFAGFSHSRREQDGSARTTEDRVFVGLRTAWKWRR